jgi:hypothetical protein
MKKNLLLLLALCLFSAQAYAQQEALTGFIQEHKNDQGFTYAFFSKDLLEMVTKSDTKDADWKQLQQVVQNIGSLSLLVGDSINNGMQLFKEARKLVPEQDFDELLSVRDGNDHVRIWVKSEDNTISDLVLLVGTADEFVLACFAGKLELGNFAQLAQLFQADQSAQLAKLSENMSLNFAVSPNPSGGMFVLQYNETQDLPASMIILDQNGRQVANLNLKAEVSQQVQLPPSLPSGLYWIQVKTQQGKVGVKQLQLIKAP